jgi:dUTP pyrophosphatase
MVNLPQPKKELNVKIIKLHKDVKTPLYGSDGAMAFDIYPDLLGLDAFKNLILPGQTKNIPTGLFFEVPEGYGLFVYSRSGQGFNNHVTLINSTGLIDSDYRGQLMVMLRNDHPSETYFYNENKAIAQGVIQAIPKVKFNVVTSLSETNRGNKGFGSTDESK